MRSIFFGVLPALMLSGCLGMSPPELREGSPIAIWNVATPPEVTAKCIARDIETAFTGIYEARVHPGVSPGAFEVFQYFAVGNLTGNPVLRALYTLEPAGAGSKIALRWSWDQTYDFRATIDRISQFGRKDCW